MKMNYEKITYAADWIMDRIEMESNLNCSNKAIGYASVFQNSEERDFWLLRFEQSRKTIVFRDIQGNIKDFREGRDPGGQAWINRNDDYLGIFSTQSTCAVLL
jgi:hypothetical protein